MVAVVTLCSIVSIENSIRTIGGGVLSTLPAPAIHRDTTMTNIAETDGFVSVLLAALAAFAAFRVMS